MLLGGKKLSFEEIGFTVPIFGKIKSLRTYKYFSSIPLSTVFGSFQILFVLFRLFQQVSSLFKDGTIGSDINIVVVSLILLEQDPVSGTLHLFLHSVIQDILVKYLLRANQCTGH